MWYLVSIHSFPMMSFILISIYLLVLLLVAAITGSWCGAIVWPIWLLATLIF